MWTEPCTTRCVAVQAAAHILQHVLQYAGKGSLGEVFLARHHLRNRHRTRVRRAVTTPTDHSLTRKLPGAKLFAKAEMSSSYDSGTLIKSWERGIDFQQQRILWKTSPGTVSHILRENQLHALTDEHTEFAHHHHNSSSTNPLRAD